MSRRKPPQGPEPGGTVPRQFRLGAGALKDLDAIAAYLAERSGLRSSRADAIRYAARRVAAALARKASNPLPPSAPKAGQGDDR